jgi:hypothetical protein
MFQMLGVFAEFERAIIQERVKAGLARVKSEGKRLGRPTVSPEIEDRIMDARAEGAGLCKIASQVGVGVSVVQRVTGDTIVRHYNERGSVALPGRGRFVVEHEMDKDIVDGVSTYSHKFTCRDLTKPKEKVVFAHRKEMSAWMKSAE